MDAPRRPDLFGQLAVTDPHARRARRLFERGQVLAVVGNQADLRLGYDPNGNPLDLKEVPIVSGYLPRPGDWVSIHYEAGHSAAPWVTGPSMTADAEADSAGVGVFPVSATPPEDPHASTVYFDQTAQRWRGWNGSQWVDFGAEGAGGAHNLLSGLQGGAQDEYYHLNAAEHGGFWQHELVALKQHPDIIPLQGHRLTDWTDSYASGLLAVHRSSATVADGFAAGLALAIEGAGDSGYHVIGRVGAERAGANNTGHLVFWTASGGVLARRMRLSATGLGIGTDSPSEALHVVGAIRSTALTAGRVTFAGTGGVLSDSASLLWTGTELRVTPSGTKIVAYSDNVEGSNAVHDSGFAWFTDVAARRAEALVERGASSYQTGIRFRTHYNDGVRECLGLRPTGVVHLGQDGAAAAPALAFLSEEGLGLFRLTTNRLSIAVGGLERVRFSPTFLIPRYAGQMTLGLSGYEWLALHLYPGTSSPSANGEVRASSDRNALEYRIGSVTRRVGGTRYLRTSPSAELTTPGTQTTDTDPILADTWRAGKVWEYRISGYARIAGSGGQAILNVYLGAARIMSAVVAVSGLGSSSQDARWEVSGSFVCYQRASSGTTLAYSGRASSKLITSADPMPGNEAAGWSDRFVQPWAGVLSLNTTTTQSWRVEVELVAGTAGRIAVEQATLWEA